MTRQAVAADPMMAVDPASARVAVAATTLTPLLSRAADLALGVVHAHQTLDAMNHRWYGGAGGVGDLLVRCNRPTVSCVRDVPSLVPR